MNNIMFMFVLTCILSVAIWANQEFHRLSNDFEMHKLQWKMAEEDRWDKKREVDNRLRYLESLIKGK